jgi:hypothetical protein
MALKPRTSSIREYKYEVSTWKEIVQDIDGKEPR